MGKMMEDKTRSIAVQWIVPSGILAMVIIIMLFNFFSLMKPVISAGSG